MLRRKVSPETWDERPPPQRVLNASAIRRRLSQKDPVRMVRFNRDVRWIKKQMSKMDLNPEDIRWLL